MRFRYVTESIMKAIEALVAVLLMRFYEWIGIAVGRAAWKLPFSL